MLPPPLSQKEHADVQRTSIRGNEPWPETDDWLQRGLVVAFEDEVGAEDAQGADHWPAVNVRALTGTL